MAFAGAGLPWAVHIADGVLGLPWVLGGFVLAGLLACWGAWRLQDDDIPRVALLSAAFFVGSLLHLPLGPTSVHLLLNGLVGVTLGRRAALAIPLGLFLQAVLLGHGGFTTLGVNACVLTLPALLARAMFEALHQAGWLVRPAVRSLLTAAGAFVGSLGVIFLLVLIVVNNWGERWLYPDVSAARRAVQQPVTLAVATLLALLAGWAHRRLRSPAEFTLGLFTGFAAVTATVLLNGLALLFGAGEDLRAVVVLVIVAHLPVAVAEGVVVGFAVALLARARPELLGIAAEPPPPAAMRPAPRATGAHEVAPEAVALRPPALLLALLGLGLLASPARAHRLQGEYQVQGGNRLVVEGWFDITGDAAQGATAVVRNKEGVVAQGKLDERGQFAFTYHGPGPLSVVLSAGAGHRTEFAIPADALARRKDTAGPDGPPAMTVPEDSSQPPMTRRASSVSPRDLLLGVTFLLALAAFVLGVRNARRLRD
jgi:cobalt/nickel transport system permease protein